MLYSALLLKRRPQLLPLLTLPAGSRRAAVRQQTYVRCAVLYSVLLLIRRLQLLQLLTAAMRADIYQ
jgi:hypothetical protein